MRILRHRSSRRGFALLLVLIMVSFAAAIAVLFLTNARQERVGTDSYAQGSRDRELSDTAVNIIIGQINTATREGTAAGPVSWASQPGMIRTYSQTGALSKAYKLYSWNDLGAAPMIEQGAAFNPTAAAELPPNNWSTFPTQYTDLNAPVTTSNPSNPGVNVSVYPIMDPTIANFMTASGTVTTAAAVTWDFPGEVAINTGASGYVPTGATTYTPANTLPMPVEWLYVLQDGTWVYPTSASAGPPATATFDPSIVTASNPIVGRIAFWTDDETNKVNLNTAGEGAYWDWPKAASQDELQFAGNPPAKNEFYRFSGHPANTSLSAIFPEMTAGGTGVPQAGFPRWTYSGVGAANPAYINTLKSILGGDSTLSPPYLPGLAPRYSYGTGLLTGSRGGTFPAPYYQLYDPSNPVGSGVFSDGSSYVGVSTYSPVSVLFNGYANAVSPRLLPTPDELFYSPQANAANNGRGTATPLPAPTGAGSGYQNASLLNPGVFSGGTSPGLTPLQLYQRGFLLTTTSKAPETTLFNTPRVSLWPITWPYPAAYYITPKSGANGVRGTPPTLAQLTTGNVSSPNTNTLKQLAAFIFPGTNAALLASGVGAGHAITPQEDLIAFCSSLNNQATGTPASPPAPLPYYFQRQNPDSATSDWVNITRNQNLANYIRGMVHQKEPGFGDSLENSWNLNNPTSPAGSVPDWIVLDCMDYSRSMINQYTWNPNDPNGNLMYSFTGVAGAALAINGGSAQGQNERDALTAAPLRISSNFGPNFANNPPDNSSVQSGFTASKAYVTQGSFPSLKEVAIEFMAVARMAPAYVGHLPASSTPDPTRIGDPFYWRNLINFGSAYTGTGVPTGGINPIGPIPPSLVGNYDTTNTTFPYGSASPPINGIASDTTMKSFIPDGDSSVTGTSAHLEASNMYPIGAQTTAIQGIMLFNFSQLRDGINASPNPCFWIKVTGADGMTITTGAASGNFPATMKTEYHGRYNAGTFDTVFQTLYGRTFDPALAPGPTTWPMCTLPIAANASDVKFIFTGGKFKISIFAEYAQDGTHTPDTDPTGDANQFVTSYTADLSSFGTNPMGMPIAPRWNVRQAKGVCFPDPQHQLVNLTGTYSPPMHTSGSIVTGTVGPALPYFAQSGTTSWVSTEIVPDIRGIGNWTWTTSPAPSTDMTYVRDINDGLSKHPDSAGTDANSPAPLDSDGASGVQWMMYATVYNNGTSPSGPLYGINTDPTAMIIGTASPGMISVLPSPTPPYALGWSMNMTNRLAAMTSTVVAAEGTQLATGSPIGDGGGAAKAGPLYTNTSYNSGGGGVINYVQEGYTEMTPYDDVISTLVSPAVADNHNIQGDQRLANMIGEKLVFGYSHDVLTALDPNILPSMVLNTNPPPSQFQGSPAIPTPGLSIVSGVNTVTGFRSYPRQSFQVQQHQLGSNASLSFMTGYQLIPTWSRTPQIASARATASNPGFALEGAEGTPAGQLQRYDTEVGLDTNAYMQVNPDWDWTSNPGMAPDGGFIERPDQDYQTFYLAATYSNGLGTPYFSRSGIGSSSAFGSGSSVSNFSPNRQVPSPIVLGTLPSSLTQGWQTLAFNPNPASVIDQARVVSPAVVNPGVATLNTAESATAVPYMASSFSPATVPDHLLLDLFWMPVAEPYPISEQFSTSGKVNLNYAMMPFGYIQRKSGLDAILKSVWIYAIPDTNLTPQDYKSWFFMTTSTYTSGTGVGRSKPTSTGSDIGHTRFPVNVNATLQKFDYKFSTGDIFRSASQICDMFLYPNDPVTPNTVLSATAADGSTTNSNTNIVNWWKTYGMLTSDNGRKAPYNAIYSRVTTQSNTYTVHWRVQSLRKVTANGAVPNVWTEGVDRVMSELRGATLIERYIDPNAGATVANSLPDYADPVAGPTANPITYYYKWRVDNETYFQPGP